MPEGTGPAITRRELGVGAAALAVGAVAASATDSAVGAATPAPDRATISFTEAHAVLAAGEAKARAVGVPMYMLIVDESGIEKASARMDGNGLASLTLVPAKAKTAIAFRTPSDVLADRLAGNAARIASFTASGFSLVGGGVPITRKGVVIGAIGVGGGTPEQDVEVAKAAVAAVA
jgi:glc operon protein GlcG